MYETERIYANGLPSTSTAENWASISEQNMTWKPKRKIQVMPRCHFYKVTFLKNQRDKLMSQYGTIKLC